ncbi:hypothetical protein CP03DC29_1489, partial [Chlamydia psittaci 03DC29]
GFDRLKPDSNRNGKDRLKPDRNRVLPPQTGLKSEQTGSNMF